MADNKKYIGEGKLPQEPNKKLTLKLKDGSVTTSKIADGAVTFPKLNEGVKSLLNGIQTTLNGHVVKSITINGGSTKYTPNPADGNANIILSQEGSAADEELANQVGQNTTNIGQLFDLIDGVATNETHKVKFIEYWQADIPDAYAPDLLWYKLEDAEEGATEINLYVSVVSIVGNPPVFEWVRADSLEDSDKYIDFSAIYVNKSNSTLYRINDDASGMEPLMWNATGKIVSVDFWSDVPPHTSELEADTEYWWYCPMLKILYHICDNITKPVSEGLYIMKDSSSGDLYILDAANQRCVEFSGKITVDNSFVYDSTNPVESKVIKAALDAKADKLQVGDAITPIGWDTTPEDYDVGSYRKMGDLLYYYDGDGWAIESSPKLVQYDGDFYFYTRAGGFKKVSDSESSAVVWYAKYWGNYVDEANAVKGDLWFDNNSELKIYKDGEFQSFLSQGTALLIQNGRRELYYVIQGESAQLVTTNLQEATVMQGGYMSASQVRMLHDLYNYTFQAIPVEYWMPNTTPQTSAIGSYWLDDNLELWVRQNNPSHPWEEALPGADSDKRYLLFNIVDSQLYVFTYGEEVVPVGTGEGNQTIDNVPIEGSNHPISSDATFNILSELNNIKEVLYGTTIESISTGAYPPLNPSIGDTYRNTIDGKIYRCTALGKPAQVTLKVQLCFENEKMYVGRMGYVQDMSFSFAKGEQVKFTRIATKSGKSWDMYRYYNIANASLLAIPQHLMRRLVVALVKSGYNPINNEVLAEDVLSNSPIPTAPNANYLPSLDNDGIHYYGLLYDGTNLTSAGRGDRNENTGIYRLTSYEKEIDNGQLVVSGGTNNAPIVYAEYASALTDASDNLIPGAFMLERGLEMEALPTQNGYTTILLPYYITINTKYACGVSDFSTSSKANSFIGQNDFSIVNGTPVRYIPNSEGMLQVVNYTPGVSNTWEEVTDSGLISRVQFLEMYGGGDSGNGDGNTPISLAWKELYLRIAEATGNLENLYSQVATQGYVSDYVAEVLDEKRTKTQVCTSVASLPSNAVDGEMRLLAISNDTPKCVWCYENAWYYADGTQVS